MGLLTVDQTKYWMVAAHLQKRKLLIAVNVLAGMSIFFFGTKHSLSYFMTNKKHPRPISRHHAGYGQGLMGGVNQSTDYIRLMDLGHLGEDGSPVITRTPLQGGIMAVFYLGTLVRGPRWRGLW